jgi:hypothetical protein
MKAARRVSEFLERISHLTLSGKNLERLEQQLAASPTQKIFRFAFRVLRKRFDMPAVARDRLFRAISENLGRESLPESFGKSVGSGQNPCHFGDECRL